MRYVNIIILYLAIWSFPVAASWVVASTGQLFSYTSQHWQTQNIEFIGFVIAASMICVLLSSFLIVSYFSTNEFVVQRRRFLVITYPQYAFVVAIAILSGVGLYLSFGGIILKQAYSGASVAWLGNGAWSISYILTVYIILINVIERLSILWANVLSVIIFLPMLLSGSRIDFISVQLAIVVYILYIHDASIKCRILYAAAIGVYTVTIAHIVGSFRDSYASGLALSISNLQKAPVNQVEAGFVNLSTFGDIGASVFQIIGLLNEVPSRMAGLLNASHVYVMRMLPGPLFHDRPSGSLVDLPEVIGNGATHSIAEGFLISGWLGISLVGVMIGVLAGSSAVAGNKYRSTRSLLALIVFAFPWLLLIRGGWYQFFAFFKAAEVVALVCVFLIVINVLHVRIIAAGEKLEKS